MPASGQELNGKFVVWPAANLAACAQRRPLTAQEAFEHRQAICDQMNEWDISGLADGGAIAGLNLRVHY